MLPEACLGSRWPTNRVVTAGSVIAALLRATCLPQGSLEAAGIPRWWYTGAGEPLQSFERWEVLTVGKKKWHSSSLKGKKRGKENYTFFCFVCWRLPGPNKELE